MRKSLALAIALSLVLVPSAKAASHRLYWGVDGGLSILNDADAVSTGGILALPSHETFSFDNGWAAFATAGSYFTEHTRFEVELGYRSNGSDASDATLMANVLYDFAMGDKARLSFGAGAGGSRLDIFDDRKTGFAAQGIAEVAFAIAPATDVTLRGRFLWQDGGTFMKDRGAVIQTSNDFDSFTNETVTVGLRF